MFDIESIKDRLVRIDDVFIPAVDIIIADWVTFDVLWECEDHRWVVTEMGGGIMVSVLGPLESIMDQTMFDSWSDFAEYFRHIQLNAGTLGGVFINNILENPVR